MTGTMKMQIDNIMSHKSTFLLKYTFSVISTQAKFSSSNQLSLVRNKDQILLGHLMTILHTIDQKTFHLGMEKYSRNST